MTESLSEVANRGRSTETVDPLARTDGRTNEAVTDPPRNPSSNASPAGGLKEFTDAALYPHDHLPHVYMMFWPAHGIIKVGVTGKGNERWDSWLRHGAVLVRTGETCCMPHARRLEGILLRTLAGLGSRAFRQAREATTALGRGGGGWSECYRIAQSARFGEIPEHEYDFESAYGLALPDHFPTEFHNCTLAPIPIQNTWRSA